MKIGAISGDLVVKIGLGLIALGGLSYLLYRGSQKLPAMADNAIAAINPSSNQNLAYQAANYFTGGSNEPDEPPLGARIYNFFHKDEAAALVAPIPKQIAPSYWPEQSYTDAMGNTY